MARLSDLLPSLGYEPCDTRISRLRQSPSDAMTSDDVTDRGVLGQLGLPRLVPSRLVRFTNPFTDQPSDLRLLITATGTGPGHLGDYVQFPAFSSALRRSSYI